MKKLQTTLDKITTLISAILCAAMMVILFANVVLRLIPGIGGFKWYMESSQYLNVWSMLIACIGINAMGTNLRVEVVDSILGKTPLGKKIVVIIRDVFIILFYVMVTYGGYQLCTRAKQAVSTMPQFTMGQVYTIFPIAGVLCILSAMGGILFLGGGSTVTIAQRMFEGMNSFALLAIPLYTFAGFTMSKGGISKRLMDFCYSIVGHIYGGLAHVNVLSSMIFAGISGSAVADTAGVSGMFMPEMIRKGYSKNFTVAVTAISSTIGIIIPPSIPMVVIAGICGISTGKLFLGGIIPGILCGLAQMIVSYFLAKKEGVPKEPGHFTIGPVLHGLWESWPALLMPIIIVGTITMGIVSPTEAGVIAVVYGLFAGGIIYRELKWEDIKFAFAETVRTSGRIFIVIGAAKLYTVMLTTAGFDKWVAKTMLGFSTNPTVILIMILLIFFIVTMFMESIATLTLFMPILYPIALGVGINPIVLSVLITVVIGVGLVTPPVGMCIYVACDLMDVTVGEVFPTLVPFIAATFVCIALMVAFPQLILLPTYLMA